MPCYKIQTALGRTVNFPFHHGPGSPYNKIKYQALVFRLDKANTCLLLKDKGDEMTIFLRLNFISVVSKQIAFQSWLAVLLAIIRF